MICRFSKYAHCIPIAHPFSAAQIAENFLDPIIKLHGAPISIITDKDKVLPIFFGKTSSNFWAHLSLTVQLIPLSWDGQPERLDQCLKAYSRSMIFTAPFRWSKWLSLIEWWYNTNHHNAISMSPFKALYGSPPNPLIFLPIAEHQWLFFQKSIYHSYLEKICKLLSWEWSSKQTRRGLREHLKLEMGVP